MENIMFTSITIEQLVQIMNLVGVDMPDSIITDESLQDYCFDENRDLYRLLKENRIIGQVITLTDGRVFVIMGKVVPLNCWLLKKVVN
jgi:hypothetical protein